MKIMTGRHHDTPLDELGADYVIATFASMVDRLRCDGVYVESVTLSDHCFGHVQELMRAAMPEGGGSTPLPFAIRLDLPTGPLTLRPASRDPAKRRNHRVRKHLRYRRARPHVCECCSRFFPDIPQSASGRWLCQECRASEGVVTWK